MKTICICMNVWATGGAENFYHRLAAKLPQYQWLFDNKVNPEADLIIYSNDHKFYDQAKKLNKPTILRITGPRSHSLPQPADLKAVICSTQKSHQLSQHPQKTLIFNGVDFDHIASIKPIKCDLLYAPARIGLGQKVEDAIKYAIKHNRHLTVLGAKQHVQENTYDLLRTRYTQINWAGLVAPDVASAYIKGCNEYICPTSAHGVSNAIIECVVNDKPIINLGGVEIPNKSNIDLNNTARLFQELIERILNSGKNET